jgi:hypothetical protein
MYGQVALRLALLLMLCPSAKLLRWFAAALAAVAFVLAVLFSPQDPDECHPEKQAHTPEQFSMAQTLSFTTVSPFNQCPGGPHFNVGDEDWGSPHWIRSMSKEKG